MELIYLSRFEKIIKELAEPTFFREYRIKCFNNIKRAKEISFKYGLNMIIKPKDFDIHSIKPNFDIKLNKKIESDKILKIFSGTFIPKKLEKEDEERIKLFLYEKWFDDDTNLDYLNQAIANNFLLIRIPKNTELEKPLTINYDFLETTLINIFILAEENTKSKIFMTKSSSSKNIYISDTIRIIAKENSKLEFVSVQNLDKTIINIQKRKAFCEKDADIQWIDVCLGSQYTRSSIISNLEEPGSVTKNLVIYLTSQDQNFDIYTASIHAAPNTVSNIITKGVLNDYSRALSRGLVRIEKNAFGSNGYESQEALLLSETAEANAIPNLEINNHDVKCSHGSSVGQIDEDKLFYLMTRGLNKEQAIKKIIEGFFYPIINLFEDDIKQRLYQSIINSL